MSGGTVPETTRDPRIVYLGRYVQRTLKLKPEKWNRLFAVEEYRTAVMDFLDKPEPLVLIILQNNAAQLLAANSFPVSLKSKAVYFVKRQRGPVPKEDISQHIILGDMAMKPIEHLAALVDEVFVPLLSNPANQRKWPSVVAQDIQKHVHSLKSTVYQVKGQVSGQTVLPMPVGVERVHEAERILIESEGEIVDLYLKSATEGVVIKWATQINDVLTEESSQAFAGGQNPTPNAEINFWNSRLRNLEYIYHQLRDERVRKMAVILEKTDSAYYPCFRTQFQNVVAALAEAKDITLYLKPLLRHFAALEETDFAEIKPCLQPLMHVVCLVWANSRYYCNSAKIIVLLRQICNLLIKQAKHFLDPASIFQSDVDEAKQRVEESIDALLLFRKIFDNCRENLASYFKDKEPTLWTFHSKIVFERFQRFVDRLETIKSFFHTVLEFMKLEKIEIGGLRGRLLSSRVVAVFAEFSEHLALFGSKTYDALDPEDLAFETDYQDFQRKIRDLDRRLAFVLCQAFDDCCNLESVFKLIEIVGSVLDRPIIKDEFTGKYDAILGMLNAELVTAEALYEDQMASLTKHGWMPVDKNMPPVAGALRWAYQLRQRVTVPVRNFKALQHPIVTCPEAAVVLAKYDCMMDLLNKFENEMFTSWAASVPDQCEKNLKLSLLTRKAVNNELALNFHPELTAILREVHYLNLVEHTDIPEEAIHIYERSETFRKYTSNLNQTIQWYNKVLRLSRPVEFALVEEKVQEIDALVEQGQSSLNWNSMDLWDYIERLHQLVHSLEARVQQTQDNIERIRNIMSVWSKVALFERSDGRKDTLLCIGDRSEHVQRRYSEISAAAIEIHSLVQQNLELFGMQQAVDSSHWLDYVGYVDNIIYKSLLRTIGCSLGYLAENMDQNNGLAPLFEAQLALCEPELVFIPSLDPAAPGCFASVVEGLINDIVKMASLIPCIALSHETASYEVDMENNEDIREMKREILDSVQSVMQEANEFSHSFETYSYLWLDDRECYMQQFLTYGRQLTADELELIALDDGMAPKPNPPNMELFREQIDNYESLFMEIEEMESVHIFSAWFQVDLRPFRQALLNTVSKWGNMFKQHLVDHVTSSLSDLASFIREADEGLQQPVKEGDYERLVNVMGYLMNVKERQLMTDDMFEPLEQTIELLKFYDQELPEEVNVLLQVTGGSEAALAHLPAVQSAYTLPCT